nr:MAG TPA: hypothetical protein [Caudoviricetes sp.]
MPKTHLRLKTAGGAARPQITADGLKTGGSDL